MAFTCPKCGDQFYDRLKFCPKCGFDFTAAQKRCPKCRSQVPVDSKTCPVCKLDFEQWAFLVPRLIVFGSLALIIVLGVFGPILWKISPWPHDKGLTQEGYLVTDVNGKATVPLFINWKTGERYIVLSKEQRPSSSDTSYMNNLVPLPPQVVFHYDMPLGEKVWIVRRMKGTDNNVWLQIGRWDRQGKPDKYGWVHVTNIKVDE
jgi:hypothetical protein